jgi:DNA-binding GntR family transcriptional regulator
MQITEPSPDFQVGRKPLHEEVAERIRQMITDGRLAPGSKLNERVLAAELAVSRTPLREAIKGLAAEKLVELLPNRGAVVARLTPALVRHLFELMAALEGLSGELAAQRHSPQALTEIKALHYEMLAAHTRRDLGTYYALNRAIHRAINVAAGNPELTQTYEAVNSRIQALRFQSNFNQDKWDAAVMEHEAMLAAMSARDGVGLRQLLEQHLRNKRDAVLSAFAPELGQV